MLEFAQRAALRTGRRSLWLARQAARSASRDAAARGRTARAVHDRHSDRHRRDAGGAPRCAVRHPRSAPPLRAHPGSHRPELPRQARHQARRRCGARSRRPALEHRRRAPDPGPRDEHPGAPQPVAGRLSAADRGGDQRLGRDLAGHPGPRQSGGAVAGDRRACRAHGRGRQAARAPAADLSVLCARPRDLDRAGDRHAGAPSERRRGFGARRRLGAGHDGRSAGASDPRALGRSGDRGASSSALKPAPASTSRRSCGCSRRATPTIDASSPQPTTCAARRAATPSATSSTATSTTPTSAPIAAAFCAFSKGKTHEALRGAPYDLALEEIVRRAVEAWERGATEVCLQGGIHPDYTGETYLGICRAIKAAVPGDAHPRLLAIGGHAGRGDARTADPIVPGRAQGRRPEHLAGHRGRNPGRRGARRHLPRQGEHGAVARCRPGRAWPWPAHDVHDHVRTYRASPVLGAASHGLAGFAGGDRRLHRIRAVAVRAYGSADVSQGSRLGAGRPSAKRC